MKIKMLTILAGIAMSYSSLAQSDSLVISDTTAWHQLFAPILQYSSTGIIPQTTLGNIPWERLTGNVQAEIEPVAPALFNQVVTTLNDANLGASYTAYSMARENKNGHAVAKRLCLSIFANIANRPTHFCENRINLKYPRQFFQYRKRPPSFLRNPHELANAIAYNARVGPKIECKFGLYL